MAAVIATSPSARATAESLAAHIDTGASGLEADRIRQAIARELGVSVTADDTDSAALRIVIGEHRRAVITYRGPDRGAPPLERTLELPSDAARATEMLALMAGNLARDEAAELLQRLRPPAPASSDGANAAPPPTGASTTGETREAAPPIPAAPLTATPPAPTALTMPPPTDLAPLREAPLGLTLVYPLTLVPHSEEHRFALELGFGYSRVGAIHGLGVNPFAMRVDRDVEGVSGSLIWHSVGGNTRGISISGVASWGGGWMSGLEMALVFLWRDGNARGISVSGAFLGSRGDLSGIGFATAATYREGSVEGVQVSGAANVTEGDVDGVEAAAAFNLARDVAGLQIGVVNIGRTVRGMQVGIVNVADEVKGVPIGLVNIVKKGRTQALTWASGPAVNAAVKYLNGPVYTMVTFGWRPENIDNSKYETGFGLGFRIPLAPAFLEADTLYASRRQFRPPENRVDVLRYRAMAGVELTSYLSLFGGLSLRHELPRGAAQSSLLLDYVAGIQVF